MFALPTLYGFAERCGPQTTLAPCQLTKSLLIHFPFRAKSTSEPGPAGQPKGPTPAKRNHFGHCLKDLAIYDTPPLGPSPQSGSCNCFKVWVSLMGLLCLFPRVLCWKAPSCGRHQKPKATDALNGLTEGRAPSTAQYPALSSLSPTGLQMPHVATGGQHCFQGGLGGRERRERTEDQLTAGIEWQSWAAGLIASSITATGELTS